MNKIENDEGDILEGTMKNYSGIFMNMVLTGDFSHGFTWSIGSKHRPRQIYLDTSTERKMSPSDLGVVAIAVSLGVENTIEERLAHQYFLLNLGIINNDDILDHTRHFIEVTRCEHMTKTYMHHINENAAKIIALRRAYESLNAEKKWGRLKEYEDRILLGYVISMLGGKYAIRPYMIDEEMDHKESWVEYYDHLFGEFSQASFDAYNQAGFGRIWIDFLEVRNDIALKKGIPMKKVQLPLEAIGERARKEAREVLKRVR